MKFILFVVFCAFVQLAHAQEQVHPVDLTSQKIAVANRNFYITQVVDARLSKDNIGEVQTGLLNSYRLAVFEQEFETELQLFFQRNLPAQTSLRPIVLRIIQLRIWEYTDGMSEKAHAQVQCQFLQKNSDSDYLILYQASASVSKGGMDVTHHHDNNLATVLQTCLTEFAAKNYEQLVSKASKISAADLTTNPEELDEPLDFAILKDTILKSGVYRSFSDFRSNTPDNSRPLKIT